MQRRNFLAKTSKATLGLGLLGTAGYFGCNSSAATTEADTDATEETMADAPADTPLWFDISLAQWSLNKAFFGGELDNLDFAKKAREDFGIGGIEYVNQFFKDKAKNMDYLKQMKQRAMDQDVKSLLIMIDREGNLGDTDEQKRMEAVENHYKWVDAAKFLGCHSIRVNAAGQGTREEVAKAATDGLAKLSEYGKQAGLNVIVENHGGNSSNGQWLADIMTQVNRDNVGTLPDFGNFCLDGSPK
ncbi:MAG: TIM barrel protein, partial [Bacteroidota bacterium]